MPKKVQKGGKGKGKHLSKLRKYQEGLSGVRTKKRKAARAEKHLIRLENDQHLKAIRLGMLENVKTRFRGKTHKQLRRLFGTLNVRRMKDILDGTYENEDWFKNRAALQEARKKIQKKIRRRRFKRREKKDKRPPGTARKTGKTPERRDGGSGEV